MPAQSKPGRKNTRSKSNTKTSKLNPVWLLGGVVLIAVIAIAAAVLQKQDQAPTVVSDATLPAEISVIEAADRREQGAFILDVREPEEWQEYHIPDSTLIPLGDLPSRLDEVPEDQEVVVVCRSGNRSQSGRDILLNAGFNNVTSMSGGLNQWRASGFETVNGP